MNTLSARGYLVGSEGFVFNFLIAAITASFTLLDDGGILVYKRERDIIPSSNCCLPAICLDEEVFHTIISIRKLRKWVPRFFFFFFFRQERKRKEKKGSH